jgi:hypothetical protein
MDGCVTAAAQVTAVQQVQAVQEIAYLVHAAVCHPYRVAKHFHFRTAILCSDAVSQLPRLLLPGSSKTDFLPSNTTFTGTCCCMFVATQNDRTLLPGELVSLVLV